MIGGHWAHVNSLELYGLLLGLLSLGEVRAGSPVRLRSGNATTVACIYRCFSMRPTLHFLWLGCPFRFTCLPQGFSSASCIFTTLMELVFSHLRFLGIVVSCYLEDCYFAGSGRLSLSFLGFSGSHD